jgi:hypothetical protein
LRATHSALQYFLKPGDCEIGLRLGENRAPASNGWRRHLHSKIQLVAKVILLSVLAAMIGIPLMTARMASPRRGLQWTLILIVLFNLFYLFAVRFIYPRFL